MEGVPANSVLQRLIFARTRMTMVQQMCTEKTVRICFVTVIVFFLGTAKSLKNSSINLRTFVFQNNRVSTYGLECFYGIHKKSGSAIAEPLPV